MENDRELRESAGNFFKNVKTKLGLALELESAVAGADRDSKAVNARLGNEFLYFVGVGEHSVFVRNVDIVFDAGKLSEFAFHNDTVCVSIFNNLLGEGNVVLKAVFGAVDHDRGETVVNAVLAELEAVAVVKMKSKIDTGVLASSLSKSHKISRLCVLSCTGGNLKDDRRLFFGSRFGNALDDFHIVNVKSAYCIVVCICFFEHFLC